MQATDKVRIELPLYVWNVVHALAFKAPTTGAECALPLTKFHEALMVATAEPPRAKQQEDARAPNNSESSTPGKVQ